MSRRREREKERENETKKLDFDKNDFILEHVCREMKEREKGREKETKERETVRGRGEERASEKKVPRRYP